MATPKKDFVKLCGAKTRRGGRTDKCGHPAGKKTTHIGWGNCWLHGGNTPAGDYYAAKEEAASRLSAYGYQVDIDPHEALLLCIRLAAGEVQACTEQVEKLSLDEVLIRPIEEVTRPLKEEKGAEDPGIQVTEVKQLQLQMNVWIKARQDAMDRLVRFSAAALKAGLEERLVRIAEVQGQLMAEAVKGILEDLGVSDHPEAPQVVRKWLTQIGKREQGALTSGRSDVEGDSA